MSDTPKKKAPAKKKTAAAPKKPRAVKPGPMQETESNTGGTFDMYHFFSRWDVIFAVVIVVLALLYVLSHHFGQAAA